MDACVSIKFIIWALLFLTILTHNIDTQSVKSMKRHMLRQVPGYDLLILPPYDTQHMSHKNSMDHLVGIHSFTIPFKKINSDLFVHRHVLFQVCLLWVQKHSMSQKI